MEYKTNAHRYFIAKTEEQTTLEDEAIQDVWGVLLGYWGFGCGEENLVVSIKEHPTHLL